MRNTCLDLVHDLARKDPRIVFLGSDLGVGTLDAFKAEMPDRFFMEGISEQCLVGMAAGMALEGKIPYVNTIGTFLTRRAFEQLAVEVCLHHAQVRLIGNGGGLVYAPLGPTHMAFEDISLMRLLPNMTIVCPADAEEMTDFMPHSVDHPGPIYIRLAKGFDPVVTRREFGFTLGQGQVYRQGSDLLLVTTGVTLGVALRVADRLEALGVTVAILHLPTVKPFDAERFLDLAGGVRVVMTLEENSVVGGLGSAAAELLSEAGFSTPRGFARVGIPDRFPDGYGSQEKLMARYGIEPESVFRRARELLG